MDSTGTLIKHLRENDVPVMSEIKLIFPLVFYDFIKKEGQLIDYRAEGRLFL